MAAEAFKKLFNESSSSEDLLTMARISEQAERYDDMCISMAALVSKKCSLKEDLTTEERNLLSVAYKNVVGQKRASWRTLSNDDLTGFDSELVTKFRGMIENELEQHCLEVLDLLQKKLFPLVESRKDETTVFYYKMAGDYYRYLSEFRADNKDYADNSVTFYNKAMDVAKDTLEPTHPTRLGLALNLSVCLYEIKREPDKACELAKSAFDDAIAKLDAISDSTYKDSTLIMQLLRDNLTLWTSENAGGDDE